MYKHKKLKIVKWDLNTLRLKPRDLALARLVYALQIEHRFHNSVRLEQIADQTISNWNLSDVAADGIKADGQEYGFFKLRKTDKLVTVSTNLVRIKRKNGLLHRRLHYQKSWESPKVVAASIRNVS